MKNFELDTSEGSVTLNQNSKLLVYALNANSRLDPDEMQLVLQAFSTLYKSKSTYKEHPLQNEKFSIVLDLKAAGTSIALESISMLLNSELISEIKKVACVTSVVETHALWRLGVISSAEAKKFRSFSSLARATAWIALKNFEANECGHLVSIVEQKLLTIRVYRNEIFEIEWKPLSDSVTLEVAKEIVHELKLLRNRFQFTHSPSMLIILAEGVHVGADVRNYFAQIDKEFGVKRIAMVVPARFVSVVANAIQYFTRTSVKTRIYANRLSAKKWLDRAAHSEDNRSVEVDDESLELWEKTTRNVNAFAHHVSNFQLFVPTAIGLTAVLVGLPIPFALFGDHALTAIESRGLAYLFLIATSLAVVAIFRYQGNQQRLKKSIDQWRRDSLFKFEKVIKVLGQFTAGNFSMDELVDGTEKAAKIRDEYDQILLHARVLGSELRHSTVSSDYFKSVTDSLPESLIILDNTFRISHLNETALDIIGMSRIDLVRKEATLLFRNLSKGDLIDRLEKQGEAFECELNSMTENFVPVMVRASPLQVDGVHHGFLIVASDLREQKEREKEREKLNEKLYHTGKLASLGTISVGIAHELNNPLAVITTAESVLRKSLKEPQDLKLLGMIQKSADRLKKITTHMRVFGRNDSSMEREVVTIRKVIDDAMIFLETQLRNRSVKIELTVPENLWVNVNSTSMESVFQNLLSNSRDAFEDLKDERPRLIKIFAEEAAGFVQISYTDNAGGMPEAVKEKMMDPFFTTKPKGKGTGLGMSIIYGTVSNHQGMVTMDSREGEGVQFTILLPAADQTALQEEDKAS